MSSSLSPSAVSEEAAHTAKQDLCLVNELRPWKCPECFDTELPVTTSIAKTQNAC